MYNYLIENKKYGFDLYVFDTGENQFLKWITSKYGIYGENSEITKIEKDSFYEEDIAKRGRKLANGVGRAYFIKKNQLN